MKCVRCEYDSNYPERPGRVCPSCRGRFAFEPREGDRISDGAFKALIDRVSGGGKVWFGKEHLYYELIRREQRHVRPLRQIGIGLTVMSLVVTYFSGIPVFLLPGIPTAWHLWRRHTRPFAKLQESELDQLLARWIEAHGKPATLFERPEYADEKVSPKLASELAGFSFDRAVVCDRARTVDMLVANNFHFENNCAVLAINGYPAYSFDVVKQMLRKNPRLTVYALHDASNRGCQLAWRLANEKDWFAGKARVVDVGLRPSQARAFVGYHQGPGAPAGIDEGWLSAAERAWCAKYSVELAVLPPDQVIKRLHKAIQKHEAGSARALALASGSAVAGGASRKEGESAFEFEFDADSLADQADASDGADGGFG